MIRTERPDDRAAVHAVKLSVFDTPAEAGPEMCPQPGCAAVVVLGHPGYYPRFAFRPAAQFGIGCEYNAPPKAF